MGVALLRGELHQRSDARFELHLLGELGEMPFRLLRRQAPTSRQDSDVELQYAM